MRRCILNRRHQPSDTENFDLQKAKLLYYHTHKKRMYEDKNDANERKCATKAKESKEKPGGRHFTIVILLTYCHRNCQSETWPNNDSVNRMSMRSKKCTQNASMFALKMAGKQQQQ